MFQVKGEGFNRNLKGNFLSGRMLGLWYELLGEVTVAGAITAFKRSLGRYIDMKDLEGYGPNVGKGTHMNRAYCVWAQASVSML